jgi:hypothetical protein
MGWVLGLLAYVLFNYLASWLLKVTMKLDMMTGGDELFINDDSRNILNIIAFHKYEKITDINAFRQQLMDRICRFSRLKSSVVKAFGKYMFKEHPDQEVQDRIDEFMPIIDGITNEKELADYMALEQSKRLPLSGVQWRLYFVPNYSETESLFVYKVHHSLADGIANICFFNDMTDEPKLEGYP